MRPVSRADACHNRSGAYEVDFSGEVDGFEADSHRGEAVARSEDFAHGVGLSRDELRQMI